MSRRSASPRWLGKHERPYELRAQPLISLAAAGTLGIIAHHATTLTLAGWLVAVVPLAMILLTLRSQAGPRDTASQPNTHRPRRFNHGWAWVLFTVFLVMLIRSFEDEARYRSASIFQFVTDTEQPAIFRGVIHGGLQTRPSLAPARMSRGQEQEVTDPPQNWQTIMQVELSQLRYGDQWREVRGRLHVTVNDELQTFRAGDLIELGGDVYRFQGPTNPGAADFREAARNRGLHARLFVKSKRHVKLLREGATRLGRVADQLARHGEQSLRQYLHTDYESLASALVVGRRGALDTELKDSLLTTGTIHLLSVSGLHLGIVAMILFRLTALLTVSRLTRVLLIGAVCWLFAAITGAQPPVMRAAILVSVFLVAMLADRRQWPINTLALAALILLFHNPTNLWQVGVQLSFLSVATLIAASRSTREFDRELQAETIDVAASIDSLMEIKRSRWSRWSHFVIGKLKESAWLSLCITLTTLPLTWQHFHVVSPIAILANVVLALPVAIALTTGLVAVILGWIWRPLAAVPAFACEGALQLMHTLIEWFSRVPSGHFWLPAPPSWWVAVYYIALIGALAIRRRFRRPRAFVLGSLLWILLATGLAVWPSWQPRSKLSATFIDVGHGTSVFLEMPDGRNVLYDCGRLANFDQSSRGIEEVLWSSGVTRLHQVILSHADSDHYNALPALIERFEIEQVVVPPGLFQDPELKEIQSLLQTQRIPILEVSKDQPTAVDPMFFQVLHPPAIRLPGTDNANSVVLLVQFEGKCLVLPGDLEPPGTQVLLNQSRPLTGGVLMAPHHGSLSANAQSLLDWSRPGIVVVSGGPRALRPEIQSSLETRGSLVYITAKQGAIRVRLNAAGYQVTPFRDQPW